MDRVPNPASGAFWDFSLNIYGVPGVASACLSLQDEHGRDVNLVLFAAWVGISGRGRLTQADLAKAEEAIAPWRREAIKPLRVLRCKLKGDRDSSALYEALKIAELEAERVAQSRLEALAPPKVKPDAPRRDDALANLVLYLGSGTAYDVATPLTLALAEIDAKID